MDNIEIYIWLFPILFIFHDFEEIIFIEAWIIRNRQYLIKKFPKLSKKILPHFDKITTSSFALGVAEEFILISIITFISYLNNWYSLWIGLFIAFTFHLIIHCFQVFIVRKYVPAIVTSVICLPICIYIIKLVLQIDTLNSIIFYSLLGFIILLINLSTIHKFMDIFSRWLTRYEHQNH